MPAGFYDYVRGRSEAVPEGYDEAGMQVYRHLVYLGVSQLLAAHFPQLRDALPEAEWRFLLEDFVRKSEWTSNYYADLADAFVAYLARER